MFPGHKSVRRYGTFFSAAIEERKAIQGMKDLKLLAKSPKGI